MRREEYIYIETGVCLRNKTQGVNTSSDFCQNDSTAFIVSGATKVIEDYKTCDFTGIPYQDILTGSTGCFYDQNLSGTCFEGTLWSTKIVTDDTVVSELEFFVGTGLTSDVPTTGLFINSVVESLNALSYDYTQSGNTFTIKKPFGVEDIRFDISVGLDIAEDCLTTSIDNCGCPSGYDVNIGGDACVKVTTSGATLNPGGLITVDAGDQNPNFGIDGALFYTDITDLSLPIRNRSSGSGLEEDNGDNISSVAQTQNSLWGDNTGTNGRLNTIGVWGVIPDEEWNGFTSCIEVPETKTYVLGIAADNRTKLKVNGVEIFVYDLATGFSYSYWRCLTITLTAGTNIVELLGYNDGSDAAFGAEIYNSDIETLSGMTTELELSAVTIFSTGDMLGEVFQLGETIGYSCSEGYALDTCTSGTPVCTLIEYTGPETCAWTGTCEDVSYTACSGTYDTISSGDTGVYIINNEDEIPFTFDFTGDTSSNNDSTNFKFEVYKYDNLSSTFKTPAVFKSEEIPYTQISGITEDTLISYIPVDDLRIDGDYLIKGYFKYNACTEFANRLGIKIDTSFFKTGDEYGLYNSEDDWYFIAIKSAEVPNLSSTSQGLAANAGSLRTYSLFPSVTSGQTDYIISDNYNGKIMVALNGLTLADGYDYTYTGSSLTLSGFTYSGDVITIVDTVGEGDVDDLYNDVISIDSPIVSGVTDNQGVNEVYFNTDTNKYELYLSVTPASGSDISITINGVTLANNIDYYLSVSNPKRIIVEGILIENDIINIYYIPSINVIGGVATSTITIGFNLDTAPTNVNGYFTLEVSDDDFTTINYSATTEYIATQNGYVLSVTFIDTMVGDTFKYRIKNTKEYVSLNGDIIVSEVYSEIIPIEIQSNNINSY